jgi:alpha-beta hydrolase superfamily lysophospholipase
MPFIDGVAGPVYYRRWSAEAPHAQVLLLHGFGEHTGHYHRLAGQLNAAGLDVWGPDHIGHGHTGGPAGMFSSVDDLAANAALLLNMMSDGRRPLPTVIVGHSLGALTGALLAIDRPGDAAGLVMTGAPLWGLPVEVEGRADLVMATDEAYLDALAHDPLGFNTVPAEPNLWRALTEAGQTVRTRLPELELPVLLINGEHDVFAVPENAAAFRQELPRGRAVAIQGCYHDIPNDRAHRLVSSLIIESASRWCTPERATGGEVRRIRGRS